MLPKSHRLNLKRERFLKGDAEFTSPYFKLSIKRGKEPGPKIGFIVSGKVGKAARRNRVKRLLSEAVAKRLIEVPKDAFLIFIAFPKASQASLADIDASVVKVFRSLQSRD